jgi:hypothetical protein
MNTIREERMLKSIVAKLQQIDENRSLWERNYNTHDRTLPKQVFDLVLSNELYIDNIANSIENTPDLCRSWLDTVVVAACWLYATGNSSTQMILLKSIEHNNGAVTLIANISGRFRDQFIKTGEMQWARYALIALTLLGMNYDSREDQRLLCDIRREVRRRGVDDAVFMQGIGIHISSKIRNEYRRVP